MGKSKNKSQKKKPIKIIIIVFLLIIILGATGVFSFNYLINEKLLPVGEGEPVFIEVSEGTSLNEVAEELANKNVIQDALAFKLLAKKDGVGNMIQTGYYEFSPTESADEILSRLISGDVSSFLVTIPEGKNIKEIAEILEKNKVCKAEDFIAETKKVSEYQKRYPILSSIPLEPKDGIYRTLEGYLFPNTYELKPDTKPNDIVDAMLESFTEVYQQPYLNRTVEMGKTVDQIVTMASIIELETKFPEDKAPVASVFYNRLANEMPLQSDITVDYARGEKTPILTTEQTQFQSPYNTYINTGLPFGPICSFGELSLEASLYPGTTNYLYFVADINTGKTYFNETLEGHNLDVQKYLGN
ncbi:MAG: endolytic transglycosylase MltG [Eubacteriaceae bacterium]